MLDAIYLEEISADLLPEPLDPISPPAPPPAPTSVDTDHRRLKLKKQRAKRIDIEASKLQTTLDQAVAQLLTQLDKERSNIERLYTKPDREYAPRPGMNDQKDCSDLCDLCSDAIQHIQNLYKRTVKRAFNTAFIGRGHLDFPDTFKPPATIGQPSDIIALRRNDLLEIVEEKRPPCMPFGPKRLVIRRKRFTTDNKEETAWYNRLLTSNGRDMLRRWEKWKTAYQTFEHEWAQLVDEYQQCFWYVRARQMKRFPKLVETEYPLWVQDYVSLYGQNYEPLDEGDDEWDNTTGSFAGMSIAEDAIQSERQDDDRAASVQYSSDIDA